MREDGYLYLPGCLNRAEVLDTRCQLASEPMDERWIGAHPIGHGEAARRDLIC